jgi:hypothetical protein
MRASDRPILDEFGKLLIDHVRDKTLRELQGLVSGDIVERESQKMYRALESLNLDPEQFAVVARLLTAAVEATMVNFLLSSSTKTTSA